MKRHIVIRDGSGRVVGECAGAAGGSCPHAAAGHATPCAGYAVALDGRGRWRRRLVGSRLLGRPYAVPAGATACPVATLVPGTASTDVPAA